MARRKIGLGSARVSRAGERVLAIADFSKDCFGETPKPARETRALPGQEIRASTLLLHHKNESPNERDSENEANALQRPDKIGHQNFADSLYR